MIPDVVRVYEAIDSLLNQPKWIDERGGPAPILVLAYPSPVPSLDRYRDVLHDCPQTMSFDEWEWLAGSFQPALNDSIKQAVAIAEGTGIPIRFVEQSSQAFGPSHTICDDDKYINSLDTAALAGAIPAEVLRFLARWAWKTGPTVNLPSVDDALTGPSRRLNQSFHPNAEGYKAITAALIEWSLSIDGQRSIERNRPERLAVDPTPRAIWPPLPSPFELHLVPGEPAVLVRGTTTTLQLKDLAPGSAVSVEMRSRPTIVALSYANSNGVATVTIPVEANALKEIHTLIVSSTGSSGLSNARAWEVKIIDTRSAWEIWPQRVVMLALTGSLLLGLTLTVSEIRRRS